MSGRQEYLKGHAEDHFKVLRRTRNTVLTKEWTPLEPGVIDHKHYRRGVGTVLEETVKGGWSSLLYAAGVAGSKNRLDPHITSAFTTGQTLFVDGGATAL